MKLRSFVHLVICVSMGVVGCASHPARPAATLSPPKVVPGTLDARAILGDLPVRAEKAGAGALSMVARGEMNEGDRLGAFVEIPADVCLLAYARGSTSIEDLDIAAFADEGNPLAVDEAPDAKPTVLLCPPHPARVYLTTHDASGEGLVALAAHLVPRDRASTVTRELGPKGTATAPTAADAWPGLVDRVQAHRATIGGTWEEVRRLALPVDSRIAASTPFPAEEGGCTDALVMPDENVALVDVEVLDAEGRVVARARDGGVDRTVTICSPVAFTGQLVVRPHVGRGLVALVLARARGDVAPDLSSNPDIAWSGTKESLGAARERRNAMLGKAGYASARVSSTGDLALGKRGIVHLETAKFPDCWRADVVGGAPLALVDASAYDATGLEVGRARGVAGATLFGCGGRAVSIDLEAKGRSGPYALDVRAEPWHDATFAQHPLAASRMIARMAEGPNAALEGSAGAVRALTADAVHLITWNDSVPAGRCLRVAAGTEGEGTGVELRAFERAPQVASSSLGSSSSSAVEGDASTEIDRSHAESAVVVRACAEADKARDVHLELHVTSGKLDVVIGSRLQ